MSFSRYKELIDYGDIVILYLGFDCMMQFEVTQGKVHQTKFGAVRHDSLVGIKFGSKVISTRGYLHVLHPSPELWTVNLPHRTQILYSTDISVVTLQLDLKPGSIVVESGTGSASLSHAILRTILPTGHLHTFDFHIQRVEMAREEFRRHGFDGLVTVEQRDVCKDGFGLDTVADAVFLDLPSPWDAVPFAQKVLIPGGRLCSFSPCIEQVQRSCVAMRANGFSDVTTLECLLRPLDARTMVLPIADLGDSTHRPRLKEKDYTLPVNKPITGHIEIQTASNGRRSNGRNKRQKLNRDKEEVYADVADEMDQVDSEDDEMDELSCDKIISDSTEKLTASVINKCQTGVPVPNRADCGLGDKAEAKDFSFVIKTGVPALQMSGHTGYLTFATLYPQ